MNKNKGNSTIILVIVLGILLVLTFFVFKTISQKSVKVSTTTPERRSEVAREVDTLQGFEDLEETDDTPEVINDEAVDELDSLILELDSIGNEETVSDL